MELFEKTLKREVVFDGKVFTACKDKALVKDGMEVDREVILHRGGVGIALETSDHKFFMVEQFRYAQEKVMLEFPAGKKEEGESSIVTARREVVEETGYTGKGFYYLGQIVPTGAYDSEVIDMYYAKQGEYIGQNFDEDENLRVSTYSLEDLKEMILTGKITDAKTIAMVFHIDQLKSRDIL